MVKSTDVEEPAPFAGAASAGDAGCCRTGGEDGNILNVNYCDVLFREPDLFYCFLLQVGPLVGGGGVCDCLEL